MWSPSVSLAARSPATGSRLDQCGVRGSLGVDLGTRLRSTPIRARADVTHGRSSYAPRSRSTVRMPTHIGLAVSDERQPDVAEPAALLSHERFAPRLPGWTPLTGRTPIAPHQRATPELDAAMASLLVDDARRLVMASPGATG